MNSRYLTPVHKTDIKEENRERDREQTGGDAIRRKRQTCCSKMAGLQKGEDNRQHQNEEK